MSEPPRGSGDAGCAPDDPPRHPAGTEDIRPVLRAVRDGDQAAYAEVVSRYQRQVFGLALMIVHDPAGAEDVAQEAFIRAYTHLHRYDERQEFYPWLATITVRLGRNWLRGRPRRSDREAAAHHGDESGTTADVLGTVIADEDGRRLWQSVAALPEGERTAVLMYYRQDMKLADIAAALEVSSGTIKTLLFRARQKLRNTLAENNARERQP